MTPQPGDGGGADRPPRVRPFLSAPRPPPEQYPDPRLDRHPGMPVDPIAAAPRPFVLTSGRVVPVTDIAMHTQVTVRNDDPYTTYGLARELHAIIALCAEPVSVAEISAKLGLHLGVARVLIGDLCAAGYLDVHVEDVVADDDHAYSHDPETIMRLIDGLRAFT